jgi:hypothetical protein
MSPAPTSTLLPGAAVDVGLAEGLVVPLGVAVAVGDAVPVGETVAVPVATGVGVGLPMTFCPLHRTVQTVWAGSVTRVIRVGQVSGRLSPGARATGSSCADRTGPTSVPSTNAIQNVTVHRPILETTTCTSLLHRPPEIAALASHQQTAVHNGRYHCLPIRVSPVGA